MAATAPADVEKFGWNPDDIIWHEPGKKAFAEQLHPRDDHGRFADKPGNLFDESPPPDKTVGSLRVGDRIWTVDEGAGGRYVAATVTSVEPDPSIGGGAGWTHVVAEMPDGRTHAFSAQTGAPAATVRRHAAWAEDSKIIPRRYWDTAGTYNPGGNNHDADRWREALGEDDQHVLTYWESRFANVEAIRANPEDSASKRFEQLVRNAPLTDDPVYRGVPSTIDWHGRIGRTFRVTAPTSGSTDVVQAASFGSTLMRVEGAPAHLIGNSMNEAVMLPGRYEVVDVGTERTASDLNVIGLSGRTGESDYQLVTVRYLGDAKWTPAGGRPRLEPQKSEPMQTADRRRFIASDDEFDWIVDGKAFDPSLHPRDDHGRFAETPGGGDLAGGAAKPYVFLPDTPEMVEEAFDRGTETYYRAIERNGGTPADDQRSADIMYRVKNIDAAEPEAATVEQRTRLERAAAEWLADPRMQREFSAYGRPEVVVASRLVGEGGDVGEDPAQLQVAGQWINGTIFLYGDVAGEPEKVKGTPGFTVGGNDNRSTLTHEYGHQVCGVLAFDENGDPSYVIEAFAEWIRGNPDESEEQNASQISTYAFQGGLAECFAECFALLHQPDFNIGDYTGGARDALEFLQNQIEEDVRKAQGTIAGQESLL